MFLKVLFHIYFLEIILFELFIVNSQAGSGECSCGGKMVKGLSVKPIKGDAVLFWSMVCLLNVTC